ncbi:MAG: peptidoglycan DD-metalloendopeptidase family protein [Actinobacteria bacterium]|nr:peptidoglycan DD-metalloendopeptidase family protein [Actinomycetota bacterium]
MRIFTFFLIFLMSMSLSVNLATAISPSDELDQIKKEIEANKKKINEAKKKEAEYVAQVSTVEDQLNIAMSELEILNKEMTSLNSHIEETQSELVEKQQQLNDLGNELKEKVEILNRRAAAIYKNGEPNYLEVFLMSEDFSDFMSKWMLMGKMVEQDAAILTEVRTIRESISLQENEVEDKKLVLLSEKNDLQKLVSAAEVKKTEVQKKYDEKSALLAQTQADRKKLEALDKALKERSKQIEAQLAAMRGGNAPGRIGWPTSGVVTSPFGLRWGKMHEGVDINGSMGQPVYAAEGGQVVQVNIGYGGGYGNYIVIYHGGGLSTLYAHLSGVVIGNGQVVSRGQLIGYVGSTGYSFGPHLHFEVRVNGVPKNPLGYI